MELSWSVMWQRTRIFLCKNMAFQKTLSHKKVVLHHILVKWLNLVYYLAMEGDIMTIVPMRDLKDTVEIERKCAEENGPVFVTKNGYGRLVVMDIDYYEKTMQSMEEARMINRGIDDYKEGKVTDGKAALKRLREKYDI